MLPRLGVTFLARRASLAGTSGAEVTRLLPAAALCTLCLPCCEMLVLCASDDGDAPLYEVGDLENGKFIGTGNGVRLLGGVDVDREGDAKVGNFEVCKWSFGIVMCETCKNRMWFALSSRLSYVLGKLADDLVLCSSLACFRSFMSKSYLAL